MASQNVFPPVKLQKKSCKVTTRKNAEILSILLPRIWKEFPPIKGLVKEEAETQSAEVLNSHKLNFWSLK